MAWLRRGEIVGDRYRIEAVLGSGGMGTVVAAVDLRRGDRVALKVGHRDGRERFAREAEAVARVTSPYVPKLLDAGELDDGAPYIAYEYLVGADLARWLAARGPLTVPTIAALIIQACHAIADAHACGIVHRDLKPANLFLTASGIRVLDFGIARHLDDAKLTATGGLVGSPAYMPPEQMRPSQSVDARGDVWSLGVVLFEAVTGRLPFESPAFPDLCLKILLDDVPAFDAPAGFVAIVRRCLEKEPADRYPTAAALADALAPFAEPVPRISARDLAGLAVSFDRAAVTPAPRRALRLWAMAIALLWLAPRAASRGPAVGDGRPISSSDSTARSATVAATAGSIARAIPSTPAEPGGPLESVGPTNRHPAGVPHRATSAIARSRVARAGNLASAVEEPTRSGAAPTAPDPLASPF